MITKTHSWYKKREYLHFDYPLNENTASTYACSSAYVSKHAFYPFLSYTKKTKKYLGSCSPVRIKERPLMYASHIDSHIYAYYKSLLNLKYEQTLIKHNLQSEVLAFRTLGKNNIHFARDVFNYIVGKGSCGVLTVDVSNFFGNLNHKLLKQNLKCVLGVTELSKDWYAVFRSITKYSYVDLTELHNALGYSTKKRPKVNRLCSPEIFATKVRGQTLIKANSRNLGIPQGSPISAELSNSYMLSVDIELKSLLTELGGKFYRYCDDIIFVVDKEIDLDVLEAQVTNILTGAHLSLNPAKTTKHKFTFNNTNNICSVDNTLQYLGFVFNGKNIHIRDSSLSRSYGRMNRAFRMTKRSMQKNNLELKKRNFHPRGIFKRKLFSRYSALGLRNFVTYGLRASKLMKEERIRLQVKSFGKKFDSRMRGAVNTKKIFKFRKKNFI